ncbi:MAG: hypothetical protein Q8O16_03680, partial [Dehalococcoidia bacterium]|nr:hypothetical protein [Dehalococcoidia bacterium]
MKSKLVKIWGVVLTLVVLIGLLVPAAAPVSAGNMQWTEMTTPNYSNGQFRPGSDVDFFVVAPDGKTMFSYSNAVAAVATAAAAIGAVTLTVDSTEGFPAASAALVIGGAAVVTYAAKTATSFTGIPAAGAGSIAVAHLVGETVTDVGAQGLLLKSTDGGVTW